MNQKDNMTHKKYFECACGTELLRVSCWQDPITGEKEWCFERMTISSGTSFLQRIKHIWQYLWKGNQSHWDIILNESDVHELNEFIRNNS